MSQIENLVKFANPLTNYYCKQTKVILLAKNLIGTVRGKSANGLMIHQNYFKPVAIVDPSAEGLDTAEICQGVSVSIPIYSTLFDALNYHNSKLIIVLSDPWEIELNEITYAVEQGIDFINTQFNFFKDKPEFFELFKQNGNHYFDLRDISSQKAYPNTEILNRKAKVVFVTGTDCGLGKRTASVELVEAARKIGLKAIMYATGQTGLLLGEKGTVVDALLLEFSNGVVSQHIKILDDQGYDLIFVEGQSDIFHPANSAVTLALLHGANPDCIIIVHDESRKVHKGFDENSPLYKMHTIDKHINVLEMLSLPCGPFYKTVGIATIGKENICNLRKMKILKDIPVADTRIENGAELLLENILNHCHINCGNLITNQ